MFLPKAQRADRQVGLVNAKRWRGFRQVDGAPPLDSPPQKKDRLAARRQRIPFCQPVVH